MQNIILYCTTFMIFGTTWFAIKYQLGIVATELAVGYRFALASLLIFAWCLIKGKNLRFSFKNHCYFALQGCLLFSINLLFFYYATHHVVSAINGIVFSTIIIFNILLSYFIYNTPITKEIAIGAFLGLSGLGAIFWPQLSALEFNGSTIIGLGLGLMGTLFASCGQMISARNQKQDIPVMENNAYGMAYGALLCFALALITGKEFNFDWSVSYVSSLLYLSIMGSIVAFGCYLTLLGRIGAGKAAYSSLLTSIIALAISTVFEGFEWTTNAIIGVTLTLLGNVVILMRKKVAPVPVVEGVTELKKAA